MKVIGQKIWNEPAVCIGLLVSIAMAVGAILTGSDWNWETIVAVLAPLATALGIRPTVYSSATVDKMTEPKVIAHPEGTTLAPTTEAGFEELPPKK
jgi:hypothetical protein